MNPILEDLKKAIEDEKTVAASAVTFINGIPKLIQDAVTKATGNGATADQLAPFAALSQTIKDETAALAAAITANTPAA